MNEFHLPDMTCGHCASSVTLALKQIDPRCTINIDLGSQKIQVHSGEDRNTLAEALTEAGYHPA